MARENFDRVMRDVIFPHEGGYVDHPKDPGGATNLGITIGTLAAFRGGPVTKAQVKALGKAEAIEIYRKGYADKVAFDRLPSGLDCAVLDYAINSGPARAIRSLQIQLGLEQDGIIGEKTLQAVRLRGVASLIDAFCDDRLTFLRRLKTFSTFGKGWTRRVNETRAYAKRLAAGGPHAVKAVPVIAAKGAAEKAPPTDTALTSTGTGKGAAQMGGGLGIAAVGEGIDSTKDTLSAYVGSFRVVDYLVIALTIAGLGLACWGVYQTVWATRKRIASGQPV